MQDFKQIQCQQCGQHSLIEERLSNTIKEVDSLKGETSKLKEEIQDIKLQQMKEIEKTNNLYRIVDETRESMDKIAIAMQSLNDKMDNKMETGFKELNEKIDKQNAQQSQRIDEIEEKQDDKFEKAEEKNSVIKNIIVQKVIEASITGGILFYVLYSAKIIKF